uniref:TNFR-Cys domain-containing protein n=1 Tax=Biomphalaria glabrata TaxID=6526 RepID=A0A2C9LEZ1_BIOGL
MLEVKIMMKIIFLLLMGHPWMLVRSQSSLCTTICTKGKFCVEDDCYPCPSGSFTAKDDHTERYCKKWTSMPVKNSVIIENGTSTSDIIWGCDIGFERKNISNDGTWDCVKVTTTSPPSSSPMPPTITSTTVTSVGTETTASPSTSQEHDSSLLIGLTFGIIAIAILFVLFMLWRLKKLQCILKRPALKRSATKNEKPIPEKQHLITENHKLNPVKNNLELTKLYYTIVGVIGLDDCVKMFRSIDDESGRFNRNISPLDEKMCVESFQSWESLNPKVKHCKCIADTLETIGYKLPPNNDFKDPVLLNICLCEMKQLNDVYKKFLLKLPRLLGEARYTLINFLELKSMHEIRCTGRTDTDFMTCIGNWSYKYPYNPYDTDWYPLSVIKRELKNMELNSVAEDFDSLAEEVTCVLKNYLDLKRIFYLAIQIIGHEKCEEFFKSVEFKDELVLTSASQCMDTFENWKKRHPNASHKKDILDFLFNKGYINTKFSDNEDTLKVIDFLSRIVGYPSLIKNESTIVFEV